MIKFLRRYFIFGVACLIGGGGVISSYMHVTSTSGDDPQRRLREVCFEDRGELVKPEYKANSTLIRVNWITGNMTYQGEEIMGLSKYNYDEELNASICEIWIPMPKRVNGDHRMDTIGHELLHCLAGSFHQ